MLIKMLLLISTLALSACDPVGDFCDVALDLRTDATTATYIYEHDEVKARNDAKHNPMYLDCP